MASTPTSTPKASESAAPAKAKTQAAAPARTPATPAQASPIDRIVQLYGDLVFDLCESVLWNPVNAQLAFRSIVKAIRSQQKGHGFVDHERAWVLQITCRQLLDISPRQTRKLTSSEQIELDATEGVTSRLKQFDSYFHRLPAEDQILMLLRDKYGLPYAEISAALGLPEPNLKVRRSHALRSLEEWLWA